MLVLATRTGIDFRMFFNLHHNTMDTFINATIYTSFALLGLALLYEFCRAVSGTCKFARNIRTQAILSPAPSPIAVLPPSLELPIELTPKASLESAREDVIEVVPAIESELVLDSKPTPNAIEEPVEAPTEDNTQAPIEDTTPELDSFPPISSTSGSTDDLDIPNFTSMTVRELRDHCKAHKIKGYSKHKSKAALAHFLEMNFIARANRERTEALRDTLTPGSPEWQAIDNILATL